MIPAQPAQPAQTSLHDDTGWIDAKEFADKLQSIKKEAFMLTPETDPVTSMLQEVSGQIAEIKEVSKELQNLPLFSLAKVAEQLVAVVERLAKQPDQPDQYNGRLVSRVVFNQPIHVKNGDSVGFSHGEPYAGTQAAQAAQATPAQPAPVPTAQAPAALQPQGVAVKQEQGREQPEVYQVTPIVVDPNHLILTLCVRLEKPIPLKDQKRRNDIKDMIASRAYTLQGVGHVEVL